MSIRYFVYVATDGTIIRTGVAIAQEHVPVAEGQTFAPVPAGQKLPNPTTQTYDVASKTFKAKGS